MKISELLPVERIIIGPEPADKNGVLRMIAQESKKAGIVDDAGKLYDELLSREESMTTGLGHGLAFPHAAAKVNGGISVFLFRLGRPVKFDSVDNLPVDIVVAIIIPEDDPSRHLQVLAGISRLCRQTEFTDLVRKVNAPKELWQKLCDLEESLFEYWYEA